MEALGLNLGYLLVQVINFFIIFIILRDHAPGQTYSVYFRDTLISSAVTVQCSLNRAVHFRLERRRAKGMT